MVTSKTAEQRYHEKLLPTHEGCIDWGASIDKYGNSKFTYTDQDGRHRTTSGHKFGWVLANGPVPEGMKLKNTCEMGSCQEVSHWILMGDGKGMTPWERYESRFIRLGPNECWPWQEKSRDKGGYAILSWRENGETVTVRASRWAWDMLYPEAPLQPHEMICHTCDNPPCQNPAHWFRGTNADNMADMVSKGRGRGPGRGEDHYRSDLSWDDVWEIRRRYARGLTTQQGLANEFGMSREAIGHIVRNERWVIDEKGEPIKTK